MDQEEKFSRIVELASAAELTCRQESELDALLDTDRLRAVMHDMNDGDGIGQWLERYDKYSHEEAFRKFKTATRARRRQRLLLRLTVSGAAAAVAVAAVVWIWATSDVNITRTGIMSATQQAVLITGDDRQIMLSGRDTTMMMSGSRVVISNGELVFNAVWQSDLMPDGRPNINKVVVPRGGIWTVRLPDGSRATLNADSELVFPSVFDPGERAVTLKGEGYFEITTDPDRPFVVNAPDQVNVRVLGTKFNIRAYDDMPDTHVTLVEGAVKVDNGGQEIVLSPNEQAIFNHSTGFISHRQVADATLSTAWTRGWFDFDAVLLDIILKTLEKWYNVDIAAPDVDLAALGRFSMYLSNRGDIANILMSLRETTGLNYSMKGRSIELFF